MKSFPKLVRGLGSLAIATALALGPCPEAQAARPLVDRLRAIDELAQSFTRLRNEEEALARSLLAHEPCRTAGRRSIGAIKSCLGLALSVQSNASHSRRLTAELLTIASRPELQPVPESMATKITALNDNFKILGLVEDRLRSESNHFETYEMYKFASPTCDSILSHAKPDRPGVLVIDVKVSICKAVRLSPIARLPRASFMTGKSSVTFEDEPTIISQGESEDEGSEDGRCIGRACRDGEGAGGGEAGGKGSFNPDKYDRLEMRRWASGGSGEERPVPLSDDQVMQIEREKFEKEIATPTWTAVESATSIAARAHEVLERIPTGALYEADFPTPSSDAGRIEVRIGNASTNAENLQLRLGLAQVRLEGAQPSNPQRRTAKEIGLAVLDEGYAQLSKGQLDEANDSAALAEGMADIALGLTPGVGWAKDVFEAVTGTNLVTGETLDGFDRSLAIFGAVTVGLGSKVGTTVKAFDRLGKLAKRFGVVDRAYRGAEKLARTATRIGVRTKIAARDLLDFSRRTYGSEVGAAGSQLEKLMTEIGIKDINELWSARHNRTPLKNATVHFEDHIAEFPGMTTFDDYVRAAHRFVKAPPTGTLRKIQGTDRLFYHVASNTFAVTTGELVPRTMYKPTTGIQHWLNQSGQDLK